MQRSERMALWEDIIDYQKSREVQREMREIADVEDVSIKADERMLFVVTKDGQFSDVMSRAVNICSRVANGAELSFARFAEA